MPSQRRSEQPEWRSDDPQNWETYFEGWYQIEGAAEVCVEHYGRHEMQTKQLAIEKLDEALGKAKEIGLRVEAEVWTVKRRTRAQTQKFEPANVEKRGVRDWYGSLSIVSGTMTDGKK